MYEAEDEKSQHVKTLSGLAADIGLSLVGGLGATHVSADIVQPSLEKQLDNEVLATKDSIGIELTDSSASNTEESDSGSLSETHSESQVNSQSTTESSSLKEQQNEVESRAEMGIMAATETWSDGTLTYVIDINAGDTSNYGSGTDFSKGSGTIKFIIAPDGTVRFEGNLINVTSAGNGFRQRFTIYSGTMSRVGFYFTVSGTTATANKILTAAEARNLFAASADAGTAIIRMSDSHTGGTIRTVLIISGTAGGTFSKLASASISGSYSISASLSLSDSTSLSFSQSTS